VIEEALGKQAGGPLRAQAGDHGCGSRHLSAASITRR
jgi:hypothetical protein